MRGRATDRRSGQRLPGFSSEIGIGSGHQVERVGHALNERTALLRGAEGFPLDITWPRSSR